MHRYTTLSALAGLAPILLATGAHAQWSTDPTVHQIVADGEGEQVQPKVAPTPDGGCYISWYTSRSGYDVRLQRLDAHGEPLWGHNGILIADRNYTSTQDYDLDVDTDGYAVLAFRDDRFGGDRVTVQRVAPDGTLVWGSDGIQFSDGVAFVASPDIATTTDGNSVVAWGSDTEIKLAKIDPNGTVLWNSTINEPGLTTLPASMHGSDDGSVIISWIQYAFFLGQKTLHAQKIDADGNEAWNSRATIFDSGTLQFGYFPEFEASPDGSSTFTWYDTQSVLNVYVQRLGSDGTELFPHNGVLVSTNFRERVEPTVTYDPESDRVYAAWTELDGFQTQMGVYAQALDNKGSRIWGNDGVEISPIDSSESRNINTQILDGDLVVLWMEGDTGASNDVINATRLDENGATVWASQLAADPAYRARLVTTLSANDFIIGAWQIGDFGVADIESHNLNPDGTVGVAACPADYTGDGQLDFFDVSAFLNAFNASDPGADFDGSGSLDFFDVSAYLNAYNQGCP